MTIWIRYVNAAGQTLQASIHTDELSSLDRSKHEALAIQKLRDEYPKGHSHEAMPPINSGLR